MQDRLVKEPALAGIAGIEAANRFIAKVYLPSHNARFAVAASASLDSLGGRCAKPVTHSSLPA